MIKTCIVCGKEFESKHGVITCSDECSLKRRRQTQYDHAYKTGKYTLKKKNCKVCGKEFETYRSKQVCCSEECMKINHDQYLLDYEENNRSLINEKRMKRYYEKEREQFKECTCAVCGKQFITEHKKKYCDECKNKKKKDYNTKFVREKRNKQPKEELVVEDLYKDFLKDKVVNAEELVSMIQAIPIKNYTKEDLATHVIDLIYSHANPVK